MPIFELSEKISFPHPFNAEEDGLLAIGGDLSSERLLLAYSHGIFPWYEDGTPILWWALDPRMVLYPNELKISKSLKQILNKNKFEIRYDTNFEGVISRCQKTSRKDQSGTWITGEMKTAYINLHNEGYAHSVETYYNNELVGGLYGISLGGIFFGESMFHLMTDASKVAFYHLVNKVKDWNFDLVDAQQETPLLKSFGAKLIPFESYYELLQNSIKKPTFKGKWSK